MAIGPLVSYPSLETISNLVRSLVDDDKRGATGTPGEGQILTDGSVTLQNFMNSAIRETYREIRIVGQPTLIRDNYVLYNVPVVNSPLGSGVMNPAVQTSLQFTGYFDGLLFNQIPVLPADLIFPLELWERQSGTQDPFGLMKQSTGALTPRNQGHRLGEWEWRGDAIWFNGATQLRDLRIRYICTFADLASSAIDWNLTYVPVMDSQEAIADKIVLRYAARLGSGSLDYAQQKAAQSILRLKQQVTRDRQMIDFTTPSYGGGRAGAAGMPNLLY